MRAWLAASVFLLGAPLFVSCAPTELPGIGSADVGLARMTPQQRCKARFDILTTSLADPDLPDATRQFELSSLQNIGHSDDCQASVAPSRVNQDP